MSKIRVLRYYLNFSNLFVERSKLEKNLKRRHIHVDIDELKYGWSIFSKYERYRQDLFKQHVVILDKLVLSLPDDQKKSRKTLEEVYNNKDLPGHVHLNNINSKIDETTKIVSSLENAIYSKCLSLPNDIHPLTSESDETETVYSSDLSVPKVCSHHIEIAKKFNLVRYINPMVYYLLGDAALFELAVTKYVSVEMENQSYKPFCNSDFVKNVIGRKCGEHFFNKQNTFEISNVKGLHLSGGATDFSSLALRVVTSVHKKFTPEYQYIIGKEYVPKMAKIETDGLYTVTQRTNIQFIIAISDPKAVEKELSQVTEIIRNLYAQFGLKFRMIYVAANHLELSESLKISIQLYSPHKQKYVETGRISLYGDYISKRLHMYCHDSNENFSHVHIISGTILCVPAVLACLLEYSENKDKLFIPSCIDKYMIRGK